jgi:hypothetical protein
LIWNLISALIMAVMLNEPDNSDERKLQGS